MIAIKYAIRLWRDIYSGFKMPGKILFLPSMLLVFLSVFITGIIEFLLFDIPFITTFSIKFKDCIKDSIRMFRYI